MNIAVAIDGPAGAGKSSIAKAAAQKLGYIYVDTGAMYRAVSYFAAENGIDASGDEICKHLNEIDINIKLENNTQIVFLGNENINEKIRTPQISETVPKIAAKPCVREFLLQTQRKFAVTNNVIMDGRDIGTVVLPDAKVKIYLTAAAEVRAKRRFLEFIQKNHNISYEEVLKEVNDRDFYDMNRESAPLRQANDAVYLDTSDMDFEQSCEAVINIIKCKILM